MGEGGDLKLHGRIAWRGLDETETGETAMTSYQNKTQWTVSTST